MSNEFLETTKSDTNLDRYGVWIKKQVKAEEENFDYFSDVDIGGTEEKDKPQISVTDTFENTENITAELSVAEPKPETASDISDDVGFVPVTEEPKNTPNQKEQAMNFNPDEIEEVDMDDFLSDNTDIADMTVETKPTENDNDDVKVQPDSSPNTLDLDIQFEETPAAESTKAKPSSSSFDDMLDELTGSSDDMVEVSLDSFMNDTPAPQKKDADEEQQVRPEPKTTVEEFSLDGITASEPHDGEPIRTEPDADQTSNNSPASGSSDSFEDISLDDFLSGNSESAAMADSAAAKKTKDESHGLDLSIDEDTEENPLQEISITATNEVIDNITLHDDTSETQPAASGNNKIMDTPLADETQPESENHGQLDEFFSDSDLDATIDSVGDNQNADTTGIADLTAIVEQTDSDDMAAVSPDFELDDEIPSITHEEQYAETLHDSEPIAENPQFDDVNALTNDLLDNTMDTDRITADTAMDKKSTELLMKLLNEVSSMKNELSDLKEELRAKSDSKAVPDTALSDNNITAGSTSSTPDATRESESDITPVQEASDNGVEIPTIDNFDKPKTTSAEPMPKKQDTGFFSDDETDETIALTGDELNNILNTADFVEEQNADEFDIPEVLNLDDTFSADEPKDTSEDSNFQIEDVDLDDFTDDALREDSNTVGSDSETNTIMPDEIIPEAESSEPVVTDDAASENTGVAATGNDDTDIDILPDELIAHDDIETAPLAENATDEKLNLDTDDLDNIVEDIPMADLDVQSLDQRTAQHAEQKIETVNDELNHNSGMATLPIDIKEEIKSVLKYMDQLLESLPEEKIQEFAKSSYFETYKKLFDDLGIS